MCLILALTVFHCPPFPGQASVHPRDRVRVYYSLRHHHHLLRPHPQAPEADTLSSKGSQREAHSRHRGDVWRVLAAVPHRQYDTGL